MNSKKAAGPDGMLIEMMSDAFGIDKVMDIINDSGEIPEDLSKSVFITIVKKAGANEWELHSNSTKFIIMFQMNRVCCRLKIELGQEQYVFVKDAGTRNPIFVTKMISETTIGMLYRLHKSIW